MIFPKLQLIRGNTLGKLYSGKKEYSIITSSGAPNMRLEMPALREILNGSVKSLNTKNFCYIQTIQWDEILSGSKAKATFKNNFHKPEKERHDCAAVSCHPTCEKGCWGEGPENCQKFNKLNCSHKCSKSRCFGPKKSQCCHHVFMSFFQFSTVLHNRDIFVTALCSWVHWIYSQTLFRLQICQRRRRMQGTVSTCENFR